MLMMQFGPGRRATALALVQEHRAVGENEPVGVHAVARAALAEALSRGRSLVGCPFYFKQGW